MTYLIRVNLDIKEAKNEAKSVRFKSALKSISSVSNKRDKVVILSHRGRPDGIDRDLSLRPAKKMLEKALNKKITFVEYFNFPAIKQKISESPPGSIFMLENIRFLDGETKNSLPLAKSLASLGDVFINDDFATAHRKHASNVGITKYIKNMPGDILKKEVKLLNKVMSNPKHPFVLIIGGAKIKDKMEVIKHLSSNVDKILLGGGPANTVLKAIGGKIGSSIYELDMLEEGRSLAKNPKLEMPEDFRVDGDKILDIGLETTKKYKEIIKNAGTVIWGGPMGAYETKGFNKGSYGVARAIADSDAFTIVGGGETTEIITRLKLEDKIGLLSTGGGAMLEFLSGKKLPALQAVGLQ